MNSMEGREIERRGSLRVSCSDPDVGFPTARELPEEGEGGRGGHYGCVIHTTCAPPLFVSTRADSIDQQNSPHPGGMMATFLCFTRLSSRAIRTRHEQLHPHEPYNTGSSSSSSSTSPSPRASFAISSPFSVCRHTRHRRASKHARSEV